MDLIVGKLLQQSVGNLGQTQALLGINDKADDPGSVQDDCSNLQTAGLSGSDLTRETWRSGHEAGLSMFTFRYLPMAYLLGSVSCGPASTSPWRGLCRVDMGRSLQGCSARYIRVLGLFPCSKEVLCHNCSSSPKLHFKLGLSLNKKKNHHISLLRCFMNMR